jgi:hypothetical protein
MVFGDFGACCDDVAENLIRGMGVAPPAADFSVVTSAGDLLYGTNSARLSPVPELKPPDDCRE